MHRSAVDPAVSIGSNALATIDSGQQALHLVEQRAEVPRLHLLDGGELAFTEILKLIESSKRRIQLRSFVWRDDQTGNTLARALLAAADRGVRVEIRKDRIAANYEYLGGNGQSFFHKHRSPGQWARSMFLHTVYGGPRPNGQRRNALAEAIVTHSNIEIDCRKLFDHSKLFIFDDRHLVLGSMGIGDNHRHDWIDLMVSVEGEDLVRRLNERVSGTAPFDPSRRLDFLVHNRGVHAPRTCPMLGDRLTLIDAAQHSLTIEMAYLGDQRFSRALLRAVRRGVAVRLVTSAMADVLGDLNLATCDRLLRTSGAPRNFTVVLHPKVVHSKLVVIDGRICDVGSANFTALSHGVYDEVNLYVDDPAFAAKLERVANARRAAGREVRTRIGYRKHYFHIERGFMAVLGRQTPRQ